ncbi:hypothetical protein ACH5RR_021414 [Cinchona calisaya]|uniref:Uncharacterized protein n=1 Tax=Cinchona calisaya TaxID=153742 RepID=A0ABD2ZH83_9GENT
MVAFRIPTAEGIAATTSHQDISAIRDAPATEAHEPCDILAGNDDDDLAESTTVGEEAYPRDRAMIPHILGHDAREDIETSCLPIDRFY